MAERIWFVVPMDGGWAVREQFAKVGEMLPSREAAIARASELARAAAPARYLVRRADGSIESEHPVPRHASGVMSTVKDAPPEDQTG